MGPCDTTGLQKILRIFVRKFQGLSFPQIRSYNEIRPYACTILGQLYFFRIRVLTLYLRTIETVRLPRSRVMPAIELELYPTAPSRLLMHRLRTMVSPSQSLIASTNTDFLAFIFLFRRPYS